MKVGQIIIALLLSIAFLHCDAQWNFDLVPKKGYPEKRCDTCNGFFAYNSEVPVNYIIPDVINDYAPEEAPLFDKFGGGLPNVSKHFTGKRDFNILFLPTYLSVDKSFVIWPNKKQGVDYGKLQFSVLLNNKIIKDWTDIQSLAEDTAYDAVYNVEKAKDSLAKWKVYNTGTFNLRINDSLIVFIRGSSTPRIIQSIFVKRIARVPDKFEFIKFSSSKNLQDILNKETFKQGIKGDSAHNYFEMDYDEIALLKFSDFGTRNNNLEYNFSGDDNVWHPLTLRLDEPSKYCYLLINDLPVGKMSALLLRYKFQRDVFHLVLIKVHDKPGSITWYKIALLSVAGSSLLFVLWYIYKRNAHVRQLRSLRLNKEETESKLQLLSGQLNPHFLFNSLNSVQNLINKQDAEQANQYVAEVSTFLRTIMDAGKKEYISLKEELEIEEAYMKLEQKRTDFRYVIVNECDNDLSEVEFPPSLLQPVIENSIHHGFTKNLQHPLITIKISCVEKQLVVIVQDNGQGFKPHVVKHGHGLTIVQNRISLINKKLNVMPVEMQVQSSGAGTVTTFIFQNWL